MADTCAISNGTIGPPYRDPLHQGIGTLADLINAYSRAADHVGVTMPEWSPVLTRQIAHPARSDDRGSRQRAGGHQLRHGADARRNYATGGLGTYGAKPEAMELGNAIPLGALATKGVLAATGRKLAPTAAERLRKRADTLMDLKRWQNACGAYRRTANANIFRR